MKEKIMIIAGCSHTSGSEIDGTQDSAYNRQHSYGNVLAAKMGYTPVNMAEPGSTNPSIARSVLEWFDKKYNPETMEVFVLVGWSDSSRLEIPFHRKTWYNEMFPFTDYHSGSGNDYIRINVGWEGSDPDERVLIPEYHRFIAKNEKYLEILTANLVLQIQYFLNSKNIDYLMCNSTHAFNKNNAYLKFYLDLVDTTKYYNMKDSEQSFYIKYKNAGYTNPKAKYWHHDETPHALFADELHNFIKG